MSFALRLVNGLIRYRKERTKGQEPRLGFQLEKPCGGAACRGGDGWAVVGVRWQARMSLEISRTDLENYEGRC